MQQSREVLTPYNNIAHKKAGRDYIFLQSCQKQAHEMKVQPIDPEE